jgi:hypothetical protein
MLPGAQSSIKIQPPIKIQSPIKIQYPPPHRSSNGPRGNHKVCPQRPSSFVFGEYQRHVELQIHLRHHAVRSEEPVPLCPLESSWTVGIE